MIAAVFNNSNCGVGLAYNAKLGGKTNATGVNIIYYEFFLCHNLLCKTASNSSD